MELAVSQEVPAAGEQSALRLPAYVLITPARNEAQFIELTLRSMVAQTALPLRWVIVSDGSTDETDDIAQAQLVSFHAGVSLDAPFEIFAAPGAEAMAAGGIPDESQRRKQSSESFRPLREPGAGRRWLAMALG